MSGKWDKDKEILAMRFFHINKSNWPCGVSDGLTLPCAVCGKENIQFDYGVSDKLWNDVVPKNIRRDVICLPCLDKMAKKKNIDLASNINFIQFIGTGMTIEFIPSNVFFYEKKKNEWVVCKNGDGAQRKQDAGGETRIKQSAGMPCRKMGQSKHSGLSLSPSLF